MPKIVDREERREEVLEAAWRIIARQGIDALSLRDLAAESGYSTGVVAHYFKDKDDVVRSALMRVWRQESARIRRRTSSLSGLAALDAIAAEVLPLGEQRTMEMSVWVSFWARAIGDDGLAAEQQRYYAEWKALLRKHLREASENGEIAECDSDGEAARLAGLIDGIGIQALLEPAQFKGNRALRLVREYLRRLPAPPDHSQI